MTMERPEGQLLQQLFTRTHRSFSAWTLGFSNSIGFVFARDIVTTSMEQKSANYMTDQASFKP